MPSTLYKSLFTLPILLASEFQKHFVKDGEIMGMRWGGVHGSQFSIKGPEVKVQGGLTMQSLCKYFHMWASFCCVAMLVYFTNQEHRNVGSQRNRHSATLPALFTTSKMLIAGGCCLGTPVCSPPLLGKGPCSCSFKMSK